MQRHSVRCLPCCDLHDQGTNSNIGIIWHNCAPADFGQNNTENFDFDIEADHSSRAVHFYHQCVHDQAGKCFIRLEIYFDN